MQIIDSTDAVIEDITSTIVNGSWLHIEKTLNEGDALMASVTVSAFGSNMLAIDDLSFSTDAITVEVEDSDDNTSNDANDNENDVGEDDTSNTADDNSTSSSGSGALYLLLLITGGLLRRNT